VQSYEDFFEDEEKFLEQNLKKKRKLEEINLIEKKNKVSKEIKKINNEDKLKNLIEVAKKNNIKVEKNSF